MPTPRSASAAWNARARAHRRRRGGTRGVARAVRGTGGRGRRRAPRRMPRRSPAGASSSRRRAELGAEIGRLGLVEPRVDTGSDVLVAAGLAVHRSRRTVGELGVLGRNGAAIAQRTEVLRRVEAERPKCPHRPGPPPRSSAPVACAQSSTTGMSRDASTNPCRALAVEMDGDDGPRRGESPLQRAGSIVPASGSTSQSTGSPRHARSRHGGTQYSPASRLHRPADAERSKRQLDRVRAIPAPAAAPRSRPRIPASKARPSSPRTNQPRSSTRAAAASSSARSAAVARARSLNGTFTRPV